MVKLAVTQALLVVTYSRYWVAFLAFDKDLILSIELGVVVADHTVVFCDFLQNLGTLLKLVASVEKSWRLWYEKGQERRQNTDCRCKVDKVKAIDRDESQVNRPYNLAAALSHHQYSSDCRLNFSWHVFHEQEEPA